MIEFAIWLLSYIVPFLAVLTVIVFVHEMGHYLVARWNGIAVQTFSVGFGRELFGFTDRLGTRWRVSMVPLGGYVRFVGDMNVASVPDHEATQKLPAEIQPRLFINKNVWQRMAVVVAGPLANILFTFVVLYALLLGYGRYVMPATISEVVPNSPAAAAGLAPGDTVLSVDGFSVRGFSDFQRLIATAPERQVHVVVDRGGKTLNFSIVPNAVEVKDGFGNLQRIGRVGITHESKPDQITIYRPGPIEAVGMTVEEVRFIIDRSVAFIGDFFFGRGDLKQLGGPVKVAQVSGEVATLGLLALVNLTALLSLNIGIFNLLPIPLLDGGHLMFYFYEAVARRPLSVRVQEWGFRFGLFVVLGLTLFTFINDIF